MRTNFSLNKPIFVYLIMSFFVDKSSVVREIWGKADTILFIFAGAAAEFALNKAVDWLYYTGRLPADPLRRLFSTVSYARQIVFSDTEAANQSIDKIAAIHSAVQESRGSTIPDWAFRDVLFMLIDYSIRSYELLERKLTKAEKAEVFHVFCRVGMRMGLKGLPHTYDEWLPMRDAHLGQDLCKSHYTEDLYQQYKKHLGFFRYKILLEAQQLVVPQRVNKLLGLRQFSLLRPALGVYKLSRKFKMDRFFKLLLIPSGYQHEVRELDHVRQ